MSPLTLNIEGLSIACKTWGNPKKPPVLALHGWLDNANSFDYLAPYFEDHFFLIAMDLPGHGHSDHFPSCCHYHFIDGVFLVVQAIDALQLGNVHLLGHSMGACLASLLAGVAPDRLLSLMLVEGLGPFSHPADTACQQLSDYLAYLTRKQRKKSKGYKQFSDAAQARAVKGYVSLDIANTLCERSLIEKDGLFYWRHDPRLLVPSPLRMTEEQILSCLRQITAKTCLIWASQGFSFDSDVVQQRVRAIKNMEIFHLEGGHHIHMEKPGIVAQLLVDFVGYRDSF
jgi:pimeloyl-ACP methyl ester carboxylesterase